MLCGAPLASSRVADTAAAAAWRVEPLGASASPRPAPPRTSIPAVEIGSERPRGVWRSAPVGLIAGGVALCALVFRAPNPLAARQSRISADIHALAGRVREYRARVGFDLDEATWSGWVSGHSDARLFDPWGTPYVYRRGSKTFTITCYGADGAPGGEGPAGDIEFTFRTGSGMPASANNTP